MAILIILAAIVLLVIGYITYGSWLAKQWGVDPKRKTPAVEVNDGVDYVAAKPVVLMGHHFSSIAGAGPINGPIQAAVFGWLPVFLWCVIGGIFFGGLHDYGALFSSVRHGGKSIGDVIKDSMGARAHKLFLIFALLVLILVVASFVNVVAGTFMSDRVGITSDPTAKETTSMVSMLFIVLAIVYGILTNKAGLKTGPATVIGLICVCLMLVLGLNVGLAASRTFWIVFIGAYIAIASLVPVWILLQPRDYLSSYLLYAMMAIAVIGIVISGFSDRVAFSLPVFTGWKTAVGPLFPALFITVACGACSGFHSLVASGTTSKQLANEGDAKPIGYGAMLIESALGIISLIAVGMVAGKYIAPNAAGLLAFTGAPAVAFADGIATMFSSEGTATYGVIYALLTLAVSVFALTSLDTATRLSRFMFSELFLKENEATWKDVKGFRRFLTHPLTGTLTMVIIGCVLGGLSLSQIWSLFGAANQLLAGLALMAVCAWLGNAGKNNKMFYIPMVFMLAATVTQLIRTILAKFSGGLNVWGDWFQLIFALVMVVLAIILAIEGFGVIFGGKKKNA
ncbi:MAG: carbon starvation protein A [Firmicutes bacterium]|nr:carbon starvation protein A [Bacillota bacterium]